MRDWVTNVDNTFYIIGTVAGPHPYPMMVRDFQSVIGRECLEQMPERGRPAARCGARLRRRRLERDGHLLSLHPAPRRAPDRRRGGRPRASRPASTRRRSPPARPACCTATAPICCRTRTARSSRRIRSRPASTTRASVPSTPGSRTPGAPSTSSIDDDEALAAFHDCCRLEGIIPALESSHALAYATKLAPTLGTDQHPAREPLRSRRQGHAHRRRRSGLKF